MIRPDPLNHIPLLTAEEIIISIDRTTESRSMSTPNALTYLQTLVAALEERIIALRDS